MSIKRDYFELIVTKKNQHKIKIFTNNVVRITTIIYKNIRIIEKMCVM